jgi:hypothetical protein
MQEVSSSLPTRNEFMALLWRRASDESLAHHPSTLKYFKLLAEYMGWDNPENIDSEMVVVMKIGGKQMNSDNGANTFLEAGQSLPLLP